MHTHMETHLTLSPEELGKIITEHLSSKGWKVKSITFNHGMHTVGMGVMERDVPFFQGAQVYIETEL